MLPSILRRNLATSTASLGNWLTAQQLRRARLKRQRRLRLQHRLKRLARALAAAGGIFIIALLVGIRGDGLSDQSLLLVFLAMAVSFVLLATFPRMRLPAVQDLRTEKLPGLAESVESWLEARRLRLPTAAQRNVDRLGTLLETLAPQLSNLDPHTPAAAELRALLGEHLPAVVETYLRIPESRRRTPDAAGTTPVAHLTSGLAIIAREIDTLTAEIACGEIDALAVRERYLETRYSGAAEANGD
jgi:hypothetical protein